MSVYNSFELVRDKSYERSCDAGGKFMEATCESKFCVSGKWGLNGTTRIYKKEVSFVGSR